MTKKATTKGPLSVGYVFPVDMVPDEQTTPERQNFLKQKKINSARKLVEKREGDRALKKVAPGFFDAVTQARALNAGTASKK